MMNTSYSYYSSNSDSLSLVKAQISGMALAFNFTNAKQFQRGSTMGEAAHPEMSWKHGYWGAVMPCMEDQRFRRMVQIMNHIGRTVVIEHRCMTTHALKAGSGPAIARATGDQLEITLTGLWAEVNECCIRVLLPAWPAPRTTIEVVHGTPADGQAGMKYLTECALRELNTTITTACKLTTARQASLHPYGIRLFAGLLCKSEKIKAQTRDQILKLWKATRAIERYNQSMQGVFAATAVLRENSLTRTAQLLLEQEDLQNEVEHREKPSLPKKLHWPETESLTRSLYQKGRCATKPNEDAFGQIRRARDHNRGINSRLTFARTMHMLIAHNQIAGMKDHAARHLETKRASSSDSLSSRNSNSFEAVYNEKDEFNKEEADEMQLSGISSEEDREEDDNGKKF